MRSNLDSIRSIIIYFSQTGNTKKIAYAIYKGMSQLLEQCEIEPLRKINPQDLAHYDLIGLGSPIFAGESPRNVRHFMKNIPYSEGKHIFSFNTHGTLRKKYFPIVVNRLKGRGLTVIGMRDWYGSVHIPGAPHPYWTDGHPDEIDLKEAQEFGREMVETSRRITAGETHLIPQLPGMPPSYKHSPTFKRSPRGTTLRYDREKCLYPKCHLCEDNCYMNFIDLSEPYLFGDKPQLNACEDMCSFCELICPTGAIYAEDWDSCLEAIKDSQTEREKELAEAENEGHFRRLVPLDKIGWDTPYYKVHNKRPRFKIDKQDRDS
ncbi:flavodoxin family protein [Chloroflexota bacterium]